MPLKNTYNRKTTNYNIKELMASRLASKQLMVTKLGKRVKRGSKGY